MKVLITGAAGMLGSALSSTFSNTGNHEVLPLTRASFDLRSKPDFDACLKKFKPDLVVHAAAKVGGIQANISNPVDFLADNLLMDTNVIMSSLDHGIGSLMYIGSSCMYPRDFRQPLSEEDLLQAPLEPTNEGYALAKIAGSKLCEYASKSHGVSYKTIIPSNLYGPGDNFNLGTSHLLAAVIRKTHEAKISKSSAIKVWGTGKARREFTFISDLADWIVERSSGLAELPPTLNVGIGIDYSVNEFYQTALEVLKVDAELVHETSKSDGMQAKLLDSTLAKTEFGWSPETDIAKGIELTYEWFLRAKESRY